MQTLTQSPKLSALQSRLSFLQSDLNAVFSAMRDCPQPVDEDGCPLDDHYENLCYERDEIMDEIETIEAEIEAQDEAKIG